MAERTPSNPNGAGRKKGGRNKRCPEVRDRFLNELRSGLTVTEAAALSGMTVDALHQWRAVDQDFYDAWEDAYRRGADPLAAEARRRGVIGVSEPLISGGRVLLDPVTKKPLTVTRYSDSLLMFLTKARDPDRYCDRTRSLRKENEALKAELAAVKAKLANVEAQSRAAEPADREAALAAIDALERLAAAKALEHEHA